MSEERRQSLLKQLSESQDPVKGQDLADAHGVSRQVIVQDIALLRAMGHPIVGSSSGYRIQRPHSGKGLLKTLVSRHEGSEAMEKELRLLVSYGVKILDVVVDHPVYGEIVAPLMIATAADVDAFMEKVEKAQAMPLAVLTNGEHIHTIEVPSEKIYTLVLEELEREGF